MKRFLILLLLAVLPLQYSWAAAAVYCQHEENQVSHFGHHNHHHEASPEKDKEKASSLQADGDCQVCHLVAQASFLSSVPFVAAALVQLHQADPPRRYSSHIPQGPIPPDWHLVA